MVLLYYTKVVIELVFFSFVFLIGLCLFVLGMIKPKFVIRWGDEAKRNRKKVAWVYGGIILISLLAVGSLDDGSAKAKREQAQVEQQQKKAADEDATAAKKQQEEEKKQAEATAQEADRVAKLQQTIKLLKVYTSNPNSAGGVDLHVAWQNLSEKTIKYISFESIPYNAVDDPVKCTIRQTSSFKGQVTGPIEPGTVYGENYRWSCAWYNNTIKRAAIVGVKIDYMDGSSVTIGQNDIAKISG